MQRIKDIQIVDMFCGAGGESTGIKQAMDSLGYNVSMYAINHWERAIETHSLNHAYAKHYCESVEKLHPDEVVTGKRVVGLMWASPSCTHHSVARGGRPRNNQERATAEHVITWLNNLYVERLIVENVPEFTNWGPLDRNGRPIQSKKGDCFKAWINQIKAAGYRVDWRVLCAADFGDPTTRKRLFVQAVRGNKRIVWPQPTHTESEDMFTSSRWRPAKDVIDWSVPSQSIFDRKKPLAPATMARIEAGIRRYWGEYAEPFLVILRGQSGAREVNKPLPTVTTSGAHFGLVQPFLTKFHGGNPNRNHSLDDPVPTIDCSNRIGLVEPLFIPQHSAGTVKPVSKPLSTVTTTGAIGLVEPFIIANGHRSSIRIRSVEEPLSTVVTKAEHCLVEPFLVQYYGNGEARPVTKPLDTVTTHDRFALIEGDLLYKLDIRFRMLQPHELAAAQGFPKAYKFTGNKSEIVKQIGNAVPVGLAKALVEAVMSA